MNEKTDLHKNDPLHGLTLETIVVDLQLVLGWKKMAEKIPIKCFQNDPSIKSSLVFLRKNPWARQKLEVMYRFNLKKIERMKSIDKKDS
ncbi:MAG: VF530 family protein [Saprospiraceae bacterium]